MNEVETICWSSLDVDGQVIFVAATGRGICCITLPSETFETLADYAGRHLPKAVLVRNQELLAPYVHHLKEYLQGERSDLTLPLDLYGTPFQISVWEALLTIPYGQTTTYANIAESIRKPSAVRAVGAAIGANPIPFAIPCHRVLGKNGALTGYRGGLALKSFLLKLEGTPTPRPEYQV